MKDQSLRVLNIEDSEDDALLIIRELKKGGYNPAYKRVETAAAMQKALKEKQWDIILCDYKMPKFNAHSAIALLKEANIDIPLIVVTGKIGEETAAECMRLGAKDYIMKEKLSRLCPAIARELEDAEVRNKQNHMDEKLRREEQRFQAFVEHSLDIIVILNPEGIVTYLNPAIERALGYKVEERIGANTLEVIHPDDLQYLADKVGLLFTDTNAPVVQFEVRLLHKDGSWRTFEAVGSNLTHNNVVESVIVNYRDITERKKAEALLHESEYKYKSLIENIPDIIFTIDLEGKITFISNRTKAILGYENSEMIKMSIFDFIPKEAHQSSMEKLQKGMKGQKIKHLEMPVTAKSGEILFFEFSFTRIIKDGAVAGAQGTAVDITERNRIEEKLQKEEKRFRVLAEQSSDIILLINREKDIIYENPAVYKILGLKREERIGKNVLQNLHPDDVHLVLNAFDTLVGGKNATSQRDEIRIRHADSSWHTFEAVASNLTNENIVEAMIINLRDITERKQAEEALRESEIKYRTLIETTDTGYVIIDQDGLVRDANSEYVRLTGHHDLSEIVGRSIIEWTAESGKEKNAEAVKACFDKGYIRNLEIDYVDAKGNITPIEINATCMIIDGKINTITICRDISERKKAQEELKENERQYRLLTEKMSDVVWIADLNLRTNYISPSIKNVLGFSQEERLRQKLDEQLTPRSFSLAVEALSREIALEEQGNADPNRTLKMVLEYYHKDGSTRWMELVISGLRNDQGVLTRIYGVSRDITDRKRMEESLRENEERFRSMIQSLSDIIFILDRNGKLTYESPSATKILGYQPGYFTAKSPFTHIHPDDLDQVMKDLDEVFRSVNPGIPTEFRYKKSDDTWIYLEALGSNQFENPGIQGIVLTVRDISERKKAEEKLQQTLESLRKAVGTTIQVLVSAVESRDSYTAGHQSRSADLACAIAREMGLAQEKIEGIRMAGIIHDIGKLSIPAEILSKPTKLTEIEFALIKEHSRSGYEMLKDVESPWPLAEIVYQHHERMNGSGYPRNLKGDEIIMESQILAVADVVEAMASHRPYRPTLGIEAALEEITKNKGILYNITVADTCLRLFRHKGYQLK